MTGFADWSKENQVAPRYDRNRKIHNNHIFKLLSRNERGFSAQRSAPSWLEPLAEVFESKQSSKNIRLTGLGRRSMLFHIPVRTWHHTVSFGKCFVSHPTWWWWSSSSLSSPY
jgi:hypothetical protein